MNRVTLTTEDTVAGTLYVSFELSKSTWKLGMSDGLRRKARTVTIPARDFGRLHAEIKLGKVRFGLDENAPIRSCYEAGRDGFWIHRALTSAGIDNIVVDPASIEMNRRFRQAKTDRLDAEKLVNQLIRWHAGEKRVWSVVRVPSVADQDERQLQRELEILKKERRMHRVRMQSLLFSHGIDIKVKKSFLAELDAIRLWNGNPIPAVLRARLEREHERLLQVEAQIKTINERRQQIVAQPKTRKHRIVRMLMSLYGVGMESSWTLGMEFFWRRFDNRRQVAASAGLTPTPFQSGDSPREQGISKAGNARVRKLMIELAWAWLRFQPNSALSRWYRERFAQGASRMRRVGVVALARRLLVDLWRFVDQGVVPAGARLAPAN